MSLRILVLHDLKIIRNLIKNYILTEYHDSIVEMAASPKDSLKMIEMMKYDVVLCDQEMTEMNAFKIREYMLNTDTNRKTSFILMTSTYNEIQKEKLVQLGIKNILTIPFTAMQLRELINEVCDPRKRRAFTRYIIPMSKALFQIKQHKIQADIINISLSGILCELIFSEDSNINLIDVCHLSLSFPADYSKDTANEIIGRLVRLNVESWSNNHVPKRIRVSWEFVKVPSDAKKIFEKIFEKAHSELSEAEEMINNK